MVYGGLLGAFALGILTRRPGPAAAISGIVLGTAAVIAMRDYLAWPWYVPFGAAVTLVSGIAAGALTRNRSNREIDITR